MSDEKFTQGEWIVRKEGLCGLKYTDMLYTIEHGNIIYYYENWGFTKADAQLISAAPDMYRALRGLFELLSFDDKYMHLDEVKAAEAALAKADGENQ